MVLRRRQTQLMESRANCSMGRRFEREGGLNSREASTYDVRIVRQGGEKTPIAPRLSDYMEEKRSWTGMQRHEV